MTTPRRRLGETGTPFVVVTGLSGAGKSHALRALEDLGYFCVDNLPVALIPAFADLSLKGRKRRRAAVVVDVREGSELPRTTRFCAGSARRAGRIRWAHLSPWLKVSALSGECCCPSGVWPTRWWIPAG